MAPAETHSGRVGQLRAPAPGRALEIGCGVGLFLLAFAIRLLPVLRHGGLRGMIGYDDGVYFGASLAFVHGALPYRDFLLLHPPGVVLAGAPWAATSYLAGDGTAILLARLAWMSVGSASVVVVSRLVRPAGRTAMLVAGTFLALYYPQVRQDRSTFLEGVTSAVLALALLLVMRASRASSPSTRDRWLLGAGLVLGISPATKIWGVLIVMVVVLWVGVLHHRLRSALIVLGGSVASAAAICLPFFLSAPGAMWRYVVLNQLGRPPAPQSLFRLDAMAGMTLVRTQLKGLSWHGVPLADAVDLAMWLLIVAAVVLSWRYAAQRWAPVLLAVLVGLLLVTPSFYSYYAAVLSVPLAVVFGMGAARVAARLSNRTRRIRTNPDPAPARRRRPVRATVAVTAAALVLAATAIPTALELPSRPFPAAQLQETAAVQPGCITADEPITLILLDVFSRNVQRHCRVMVDLGGYSYNERGSHIFPRTEDPRIQGTILRYLASGQATILTRFYPHVLSRSVLHTVRSWPVLAADGHFVLRTPRGVGAE